MIDEQRQQHPDISSTGIHSAGIYLLRDSRQIESIGISENRARGLLQIMLNV